MIKKKILADLINTYSAPPDHQKSGKHSNTETGSLETDMSLPVAPQDILIPPSLPQHRTHSVAKHLLVDVLQTMEDLLNEEDTDGDRKITVEDLQSGRSPRGDGFFMLKDVNGQAVPVAGTYKLGALLQELAIRYEQHGAGRALLDPAILDEPPCERISRLIRERCWDGLTRRIDGEHLSQILRDEKVRDSGPHRLYVPPDDPQALAYFQDVAHHHPELNLAVEPLPTPITGALVKQLDSRHGLLSLKLQLRLDDSYEGVPFVVPGGRFNEMYGWDSYFETLGLLADGRMDLALAMVENHVYQIEHYGKVLNANRTYYLGRSQPPFLTSMALAVFENMPPSKKSRTWLISALHAAKKEYELVWTTPERTTAIGLTRYFGQGEGPPPEVEPGHFDWLYENHAQRLGMEVRAFEAAYQSGKIKNRELDLFFMHDRAMRESGHDTCSRWYSDGYDRCADFATIDLNTLLFKMEIDLALTIDREFNGKLSWPDGSHSSSTEWFARAAKRKELILQYLWDEKSGIFFDYDTKRNCRHDYISAATLYPLWASNPDSNDLRLCLVTPDQATGLVAGALQELELAGGLASGSRKSLERAGIAEGVRQWDYPHGWPPHQMLVWEGLRRFGMEDILQRLVYRWLFTITLNAAAYNCTIPEKYDVAARTHKVFAEYGNQGTTFEYITPEGFGWMNASYQVGLGLLRPNLRYILNRLVPPEQVFEGQRGSV